jgi:DedD protein
MSDEGFHEIQLNGKQLVFLFMSGTVILVVIFLCGVMVGRGVQTARGATSDVVQESASAVRPGEPAAPAGESTPPAEPPPPAEGQTVEDDDYYDRLVEEKQSESLKAQSPGAPRSKSMPAAKPATPEPKPAAVAEKPAPASNGPSSSDSDATSSGRYAVQLAALRERNEADALVKRLVAKGYQAYVVVPPPGAPPVYRVQVGRFKSRSDADRTAARLRKEERFTPWVTR